jgi:cob(I)alamin adenosyltransferase
MGETEGIMKKRQSKAAELHAARLEALESVRDAERGMVAARETFDAADTAWREHLRAERNSERGAA